MYLFGAIFMTTAILVFLFKNERSKVNIEAEKEEETSRLSLFQSYMVIWRLFGLNAVGELALLLVTANVCILFVCILLMKGHSKIIEPAFKKIEKY